MYLPAHFAEVASGGAARLHRRPSARPARDAEPRRRHRRQQRSVLPRRRRRRRAGRAARPRRARQPALDEARDDVDALVVFQGPHGYVSPAWYPSKAEHGKVVPTWNYVMVQARGRLRAIDDKAWLRAFVTRLTDRHEGGRAGAVGGDRRAGRLHRDDARRDRRHRDPAELAGRQVEGEPEPQRRRPRRRRRGPAARARRQRRSPPKCARPAAALERCAAAGARLARRRR